MLFLYASHFPSPSSSSLAAQPSQNFQSSDPLEKLSPEAFERLADFFRPPQGLWESRQQGNRPCCSCKKAPAKENVSAGFSTPARCSTPGTPVQCCTPPPSEQFDCQATPEKPQRRERLAHHETARHQLKFEACLQEANCSPENRPQIPLSILHKSAFQRPTSRDYIQDRLFWDLKTNPLFDVPQTPLPRNLR